MAWLGVSKTRRLLVLLAAMMVLGLVPAQAAWAASQDITSNGPLTDVWVGDDLTCQVAHTGDAGNYEFYNPTSAPGSCGTFLSVDSSAAGAGPQSFGGVVANTGYTLVSQSATSGSGTSADPYRITTIEDAGSTGLRLTEVDSYVVGNEYYRTDITVANSNASGTASGRLYHAADCYLQGSDSGYGYVDTSTNAVACAQNANNSPAALIEEFAPLTAGAKYVESGFSTVWDDVRSQADLPSTCGCDTNQDNGMGINWDFSLAPGASQTFSLLSNFSPSGAVAPDHTITAAGGNSFSGIAPFTVNDTLASFSDSKADTAPGEYAATIDWGDGSSGSAGTVSASGGSFSVSGNHMYSTAGSYTISVTISDVNGNANSPTVNDSASVSAAPVTPGAGSPTPTHPGVATGSPTPTSSTAANLSGSANPGGLPTTAHWEYGLDPNVRGPGFTGNVYDQSTPSQPVGSDFSSHTLATSVSNLVPNALYHVRLVATNSAGTTVGPDRTFTTPKAGSPPPPVVGQNANFTPVGTVFVLLNGQFVKLTQPQQLPSGTVVDALHGSLNLVAATGKKGQKYTGTFSGAVFKVTQARSGADKALTTLSIVEGAFKGAPSYVSCKAKGAADGFPPRAHAALSARVLQTLRSSARGRFRTRGRYAAATVRGTRWTTVDRCDGTLISVQLHSVLVNDLVRSITRIVNVGHSYLARAKKTS
jgi:hypothetical protein